MHLIINNVLHVLLNLVHDLPGIDLSWARIVCVLGTLIFLEFELLHVLVEVWYYPFEALDFSVTLFYFKLDVLALTESAGLRDWVVGGWDGFVVDVTFESWSSLFAVELTPGRGEGSTIGGCPARVRSELSLVILCSVLALRRWSRRQIETVWQLSRRPQKLIQFVPRLLLQPTISQI